MVVSPLRNMAYFLLQMSPLGIYLLNCKGRKIVHISVIRHARNTSENPIRLVIKKEKATVWYYVDLKALPEGFLFINYFRGFFSLFCLWIEHQCKLVYTHNAEQIKNKDDKGKRWIHCSSPVSLKKKYNRSRTHLYNISTHQKKNAYVYANSLSWPARMMVVMKHFACSVSSLIGCWTSRRCGEATATWIQTQTPGLSGWKKMRVTVVVCMFMFVCHCMCAVLSLCAFALIHRPPMCVSAYVRLWCLRSESKWWNTCPCQFSKIFFCELGAFSALKVIVPSIKNSLGCETSGKQCMSTQSQSPIHGQWSSSKLYISMSSQIRVSVLWFSCSWLHCGRLYTPRPVGCFLKIRS